MKNIMKRNCGDVVALLSIGIFVRRFATHQRRKTPVELRLKKLIVASCTLLATCALNADNRTVAENLPTDYTRIAYVATDGGQWINTGYCPGTNTIVEGDIKVFGECRVPTDGALFGIGKIASGAQFSVNFGSDTTDNLYVWCGPGETGNTARFTGASSCHGQRVKIGFDSTTGIFTYGEKTKSGCKVLTSSMTQPFIIGGLFNANQTITTFKYFNMCIYGWKIWSGDTLVRDYVPCVRKLDGVAGLYDLQNGDFCPSEGGMPFLANTRPKVLEFPGTTVDAYVSTGFTPSLSDFSASVWVKNVSPGDFSSNDGTKIGAIFSQGSIGVAQGFSCYVFKKGDALGLRGQLRNSSGVVQEMGVNWLDQANDDKWHLITVTYDQVLGEFLLYVDAEQQANVTQSTTTPISNQPVVIGARMGSDGAKFPVKGRVAEMSLWNRVLSRTEVRALLRGRLVGSEPGLIGYWPLDKGSPETIANDSVANGSARHHADFRLLGLCKDQVWHNGFAVILK